MSWQSQRKQLEAAANGALSVSLRLLMPVPLFPSGDTAIAASLLFSVLHSPPTVLLLPNSMHCDRSSPWLFPFTPSLGANPCSLQSVTTFPPFLLCVAPELTKECTE